MRRHPLDLEARLEAGLVQARARPLELRREKGRHFTFGPAELLDLSTMDVVLLRARVASTGPCAR